MHRTYALVGLLLISVASFAQEDRATLTGSATDSAGRLVDNASVSVTDVATGIVRTALTNASGRYVLTGLVVGNYRAECSATSFETIAVQEFKLAVGQETIINFKLMPPSVNTKIEVVSVQPMLNMTSAVIGSVIEGTQVQNLPLNGRDWNSLSALVPGAINSGTGNQGSIRFAGHAEDDNNFRIDGVDATGILNQDQKVNIRLQISTEAIAEFRANSAAYTAETGGTNGGQVEVVSKSGSNNLHGSMFEFIRNDIFDAQPFGSTTKLPFRLNQFGSGVGGPIIKNKTFFFTNYEGLRQTLAQPLNGLVPSAAFRAAVLAASPALQPILAAYPVGTVATSDPNVVQWFGSGRQLASEDSGIIRVDHQISTKLSTFSRYLIDNATTDAPIGGNGGFLKETNYNNVRPQNLAVGSQQVFSSVLMNDARFGFNRSYNTTGNKHTMPYSVTVPSFTTLNDQTSKRFGDNTFSLNENATGLFGRHTVKAGAEIRRVEMNNTTNLTPSNTLAFTNEQAFQANQIAQVNLNAVLPVTGLRKTMYFGYIQDEVRLKANLTATSGLRYEFFNAFHEVNNNAKVFDPYSCGLQGYCLSGADFYLPRFNDLAPRVSIVWAPVAFQGKTIINAGFGRYFGEGQLGDLNAPTANIATRITLNQSNAPGLSYPVLPYVSGAVSSITTPRGLERNRRDAAVDEWNLFIQQQMGSETIFQVGYLGSKGDHLFTRTYINTINPASGLRPFPRFGLTDYIASYANSSFHALQVQLRRSFIRGLLFTANYQWSHSIDDGTVGGGEADYAQNVACQECEKAVSDQDIKSFFTASMVYELPFGRGRTYLADGHGVANVLVSGWKLSGIGSARTGQPVNVTISRSASALPDQNISSPQRPDLVPGVPLNGTSRMVHRWFNAAAFATPPAGRWGDLSRNALRGPGLWQIDPALTKDTKLSERYTFQFRFEGFNILNRDQLGNPSGNFSSPLFGQITQPWNTGPIGTGTPRQLQFMGRLSF